LMGLEPNFCFHTPSCDRIVPCLKPVTSPASTAALNVLITDHPITQILFWIGTNRFNSFLSQL